MRDCETAREGTIRRTFVHAGAALALCALAAMTTASSAQTRVDCYTADELTVGSRFAASQITVQRNARCSYGGALSAVRIETPPRHGRLQIAGRGMTYIPNPGYVGPDSYVYSGNASGGGGRGNPGPGPTGRVRVTVTVTVE